jgi:hypothetical protein
MPACELKIVLDREDGTYGGGDSVTGRVEVTAAREVECRALSIALEWKASGKGNTETGRRDVQVLYRGSWREGAAASYDFEVAAPDRPLSFDGKLFRIGWFVTAAADLRLAGDAGAEKPIRIVARRNLVGGSPDRDDDFLSDQRRKQILGKILRTAGWRARLLLALQTLGGDQVFLWLYAAGTTAAIALAVQLWRIWSRGEDSELPGLLLVVLFVVLAALVAGRDRFRRAIASRRIGPVEVTYRPTVPTPGENLSCCVRFQPRTEISLDKATLQIVAREEVVRGSGKHKRTLRAVVHRSEAALPARTQYFHGEAVELEGTVQIPADAPVSFFGSSNRVQWTLEVRLHLGRWIDWKQQLLITVLA